MEKAVKTTYQVIVFFGLWWVIYQVGVFMKCWDLDCYNVLHWDILVAFPLAAVFSWAAANLILEDM